MAKLLEEIVETRAADLALADDRGETTWGELGERVDRLINGLTAAGISPGDTVAMMAGNRAEAFELFWAAAHLGITYVPVNWHWVADELAYVIADSGATAILVGDRFAEVAAEALVDPRADQVSLALVAGASATDLPDGLDDYEAFLAAADPAASDLAMMGGPMFYTSGTTGHPKGVRGALAGGPDVPSEVLQLVSAGINEYVPPAGRTLLAGPVYHSAQWAFAMMPMVSGGSAVVMRHRFDAAETLELIDRYDVTNTHLVPTQFKRLLELPEPTRDALDGASLDAVWHGAAPCPPPWKRAMIDWVGPKVHEYYGSTEGAFISRIRADEWLERGGSVGRPLETIEVVVVDEDDEPAPSGEPGTLYFRNLMGLDFEYHNDPDKTEAAHREPGVFTTGDIGYLDDDGYLWLSDRKIDMIISGGVNIYPAEIESVLAEHAGVADVAVIGVPDDEFGEQVKAVVQPREPELDRDALERELVELCGQRLAGYKRPRSIDWTDDLPRTGTGKILKRELRAPYWEGTGRTI
jgi:long-chain acyl-CoA synthetase